MNRAASLRSSHDLPQRCPAGGLSQADLAAAPMAPELVVADLGASLHAEPLRERPVLVKFLSQVLLQLECLHGAHLCLAPTWLERCMAGGCARQSVGLRQDG